MYVFPNHKGSLRTSHYSPFTSTAAIFLMMRNGWLYFQSLIGVIHVEVEVNTKQHRILWVTSYHHWNES